MFCRENEAKHQGSKGDIAARIEADTQVKIEAMNRSVAANKEKVCLLFSNLAGNCGNERNNF